jgi:hypothetical protein
VLFPDSTGGLEIVGDQVYFHSGSTYWRMELDGAGPAELGATFGGGDFDVHPTDLQLYRPRPGAGLYRSELDGSSVVSLVAASGDYLHDVWYAHLAYPV